MKTLKIIILALIIAISIVFFLPRSTHNNGDKNGINDTITIIHQRKSVRTYQDKAIPNADLETLVKAGMAAPTAGDKRPWAFIIINDKATLKALGEGMQYGSMLSSAGGAIVVCGVPSKSFPGKAQEFWVQDTSAATENILLAAEAIELGAVWIGVYPIEENIQFVKKVLEIPEDVIPLNIISIGYPTGVEKPKNKFDSNVIHTNRW